MVYFLLIFLTINSIFATNNTDLFINNLLPQVKSANADILKQRDFLLLNQFSTDEDKIAKINALANKYKIKNWQITSPKAWDKLLSKVDTWPESLVLAQAILESGFGKSRFAAKANNLFGIWCFTEGCGIVPLKRSANALHEIRKFKSIQQGIDYHLLNLNTHQAYEQLRSSRKNMKSSIELCKNLNKYSEKGEQYGNLLIKIIKQYKLQKWDV